MMCFRDMSFCSSNCTNVGCHRHYGPDEKEAARRWWRDMPGEAPVAFMDFSPNCRDYIPPRDEQ
jgi:hypothetical protein